MICTTFYKTNGEITVNLESSLDVRQATIDVRNELWIDGTYSADEYYIDNNIPVQKPPKPNKYAYFDYDTKSWVLDTDYLFKMHNFYNTIINDKTGDVITLRYPLYSQLNNIGTIEYEPMRIWIDSKRTKANNARIEIDNATTEEECNIILQNFINTINED